MNNTLTASEIRCRGMAAIEEALSKGPVQLLKRNKPVAVVLSQNDYELIEQPKPAFASVSTIDWLLAQPPGKLTKKEADEWISEERSSW